MKKTTIFLTVIIFLISACTEKMDIDLNSGINNRLVVDGGITNEAKVHIIRLSRSTDYFINESTPGVTGAEVSVSDGENTIEFTDNNNDGIYESPENTAGEVNKTYTLNIKLDDGEVYTAESYLSSVDSIDYLQYEYFEEFDSEDDGPPKLKYFYTIYLYAQESPVLGQYYMWNLFVDNELDSDTLSEKVFVSDENVNGNYIWEFDIFYFDDEEIVNDTTNIKVSMMSISKEQYDHHLALMLETEWRGGIFDGPPANVPTNISNGGLGFFYANAVTYSEIDILYKTNPDYWE